MARPRKKKEEVFKNLLAGIAVCEREHYVKDVLEKDISGITMKDFENALDELGFNYLSTSDVSEICSILEENMRCTKQRERRRLL